MSNASPTVESAPAAPSLHRAGTLVYTSKKLGILFAWLLSADVFLTMIERVEAKILPVILKAHEASDKEIAIVVSSIAAIMQLLVTPVLSYHSDRRRGPRGRRIPYLLWATPIVSVTLFATPYSPAIAEWMLGSETLARWLARLPCSPVIFTFGMIAVGFRFGHAIISTMFFSLFRDVVPSSHMGRFLAMFRVVGALSTFVTAYWLLGRAETHQHEIFIILAVLNLLGFLGICFFVKEGEYPPVVEKTQAAAGSGRIKATVVACRNFIAESYVHPIYWWTYICRLFIYAAVPISGFIVFFPQRELGMELDQVGKLMSWPAIAWLAAAYPVGKWLDRVGVIRVMIPSLAILTVAYALSFFAVVGEWTFFVSSFVTGLLYWVVMLGQIALAQEIFHRDRYAQLSSAGIIVQSIALAFVLSPLAGWILDALEGFHAVITVPALGDVTIGRYRFVNLILAVLYGVSLIATWQIARHRRRHCDANGIYVPPL